MVDRVDIEVVRGEDLTIELTVTNEDGDRVDLTGGTVYFRLKNKVTDNDPALLEKSSAVPAEITILNQVDPLTKGQAEIYLVPADTEDRTPGVFYYDIWVQLAGGKRHPVVRTSKFLLEQAITQL